MHRLIEASAELIEAKDMQRGLDKAKEAGKGISHSHQKLSLKNTINLGYFIRHECIHLFIMMKTVHHLNNI